MFQLGRLLTCMDLNETSDRLLNLALLSKADNKIILWAMNDLVLPEGLL